MTFVRSINPPLRFPDPRSGLPMETTGFIESTDERRPARATGSWEDVWSRMPQTETALDAFFALMMQKHFGASIVTVPAPTAEQLAEMEQREAELAAMSDDALVALWEAADDKDHCCDDIWAEAQRRGLLLASPKSRIG